MTPKISVYQLRSKFVNKREDVPEDAKQIVYYTLAVGHHVGVMDCFTSQVDIPLDEYAAWVRNLPEGPARTKLEGAVRWGEIEVNLSHVGMLLPLFEAAQAEGPGWTRDFVQCLHDIQKESAMYLMVKEGRMNVLLTVGNGMMGDDGAGVLLAQMFRDAPLEEWTALNGGSAPENVLHRIREMDATRVLVVDAADMDLEPGSIRRIHADRLDDPFLMTTHTLPLTFLIESLREFVPQVDLLGIQPNIVAFGFPMSDEVRAAVGQVYADLKNSKMDWSCCN